MSLLDDLISLFFPCSCRVCGNSLYRKEEVLCLSCRVHLPATRFETDPENAVARTFWGRVPLDAAMAAYCFRKGNAVQRLIHRLKYQGDKELGVYLGTLLGKRILARPPYQQADLLVPIPLHVKKLRKRGYNQSERLAAGVAEITGIRLNNKLLRRKSSTQTQTRKSRYERWVNVSEVFELSDPEAVEGKRVMLVDDVITTGATLESAAQVLLDAGAAGVVVVAFASALR